LNATARDYKLPVARFWPKGRLPIGPDYPESAPQASPKGDIVDVVASQELRRLLRRLPDRLAQAAD
jgi:hypothetical protein